jgi:hypothetical protein
MNSEAMILKRDAGGRVMVPLARQIELVREYERSGLSGPKFAAMAARPNRRDEFALPPLNLKTSPLESPLTSSDKF